MLDWRIRNSFVISPTEGIEMDLSGISGNSDSWKTTFEGTQERAIIEGTVETMAAELNRRDTR